MTLYHITIREITERTMLINADSVQDAHRLGDDIAHEDGQSACDYVEVSAHVATPTDFLAMGLKPVPND